MHSVHAAWRSEPLAARPPVATVTVRSLAARRLHQLARALGHRAARSEDLRRLRTLRRYRRNRTLLEPCDLRFQPGRDDVLNRAGA